MDVMNLTTTRDAEGDNQQVKQSWDWDLKDSERRVKGSSLRNNRMTALTTVAQISRLEDPRPTRSWELYRILRNPDDCLGFMKLENSEIRLQCEVNSCHLQL